jgi:hypothetical protein
LHNSESTNYKCVDVIDVQSMHAAARELEEHSGPIITEAIVTGGAAIPNAFQQNIPVSITNVLSSVL